MIKSQSQQSIGGHSSDAMHILYCAACVRSPNKLKMIK